MSEYVVGNHNNLHDIEVQFEVVTETLEQADIAIEGHFLNADVGFDSKNFRESCSKKRFIQMFVSINVTEIQIEMNTLTKICITNATL